MNFSGDASDERDGSAVVVHFRSRVSTARSCRPSVAALAAALILVGCANDGAPSAPPDQTRSGPPTLDASTRSPSPPSLSTVRCATGRLTVGDLPVIADDWQGGLATATERAQAWRADARLVSVRVACQPLDTAFRWQGVFYSDSAQSFFESDTGRTEPAEIDPTSVQTLPIDQIAFQELHRTLARAGYGDDRPLSATGGISMRLNTPTDPFGPPEMPPGVVYHVAASDGQETRDLFVGGADWTIRTYVREPAV